jgi:hypothetical protein
LQALTQIIDSRFTPLEIERTMDAMSKHYNRKTLTSDDLLDNKRYGIVPGLGAGSSTESPAKKQKKEPETRENASEREVSFMYDGKAHLIGMFFVVSLSLIQREGKVERMFEFYYYFFFMLN